MKRIDEQIQWYKQNANSLYDDMISIELEKIQSLYARYEDHTDEMFVEEMIESFCKIIERQREKIGDLEMETIQGGVASEPMRAVLGHNDLSQSYMAYSSVDGSEDGFQDDKQLQAVFTQYCLSNGSSSYTVNDYCSRIKKIWKSYEEEYRSGELAEHLSAEFPDFHCDAALLNAYEKLEVLGRFVREKITETDANRNWLNARAALNKFGDFKAYIKK